MRRALLCVPVVLLCACGNRSLSSSPAPLAEDWPSYGRDPGGTRSSPLGDINRDNVGRLSQAWVAHTGEKTTATGRRVGFESTPIVVDGTLYFTTGTNRILALDPDTGAERWQFDPKIDPTANYGDGLINRGVATWLDASAQPRSTRGSSPSMPRPAHRAPASAPTAR